MEEGQVDISPWKNTHTVSTCLTYVTLNGTLQNRTAVKMSIFCQILPNSDSKLYLSHTDLVKKLDYFSY